MAASAMAAGRTDATGVVGRNKSVGAESRRSQARGNDVVGDASLNRDSHGLRRRQTEDKGKRRQSESVRHDVDGETNDPIPLEAAINPNSNGVKYNVPPQTAGRGLEDHDQVQKHVQLTEQKKHLNPFHHHEHDAEKIHVQRYTATPQLDEWRRGKVARLNAADLSLEVQDVVRDKAWWEGGSSRNRHGRQGKSRALVGVDGTHNEKPGMIKIPLSMHP
jgi:hypothetical protein